MYNDFRGIPGDPLDMSGRQKMFVEDVIKQKDEEIKRLKGMDGENDAVICKKIREMIMNMSDPAAINQLTAALANMMTVIGRKE